MSWRRLKMTSLFTFLFWWEDHISLFSNIVVVLSHSVPPQILCLFMPFVPVTLSPVLSVMMVQDVVFFPRVSSLRVIKDFFFHEAHIVNTVMFYNIKPQLMITGQTVRPTVPFFGKNWCWNRGPRSDRPFVFRHTVCCALSLRFFYSSSKIREQIPEWSHQIVQPSERLCKRAEQTDSRRTRWHQGSLCLRLSRLQSNSRCRVMAVTNGGLPSSVLRWVYEGFSIKM